jgi:hypothetical protein
VASGSPHIDITTASGIVIARHRRAPDGAGRHCARSRPRHSARPRGDGRRDSSAARIDASNASHPAPPHERLPPCSPEPTPPPPGPSPISPPTREQPKEGTPSHDQDQQPTPGVSPPPAPPAPPAPSTMAQASLYQTLRSHLAVLKLDRLRRSTPTRARRSHRRTAVDDRDTRAAVRDRSRHRAARRLVGRLRFACLPTPATLDDFDFDAQPGVDRN